MKHERLHIGGMACVNCQNKIEQKLRSTAGVESASVSYGEGIADIVYDPAVLSRQDIEGLIAALGYTVQPGPQSGQGSVGRTVCLLVVVICLYILLQRFGILNLLAPSQLADTGMGYGMLFVTGLLTSVHCIAMCGGINLSQCIPRQGAEAVRGGAAGPALLYNLGRVLSYTAIGFLLGLVGYCAGGGGQTGLSAFWQGVLKLIAGALMVVMGAGMLELFPGLRRWTPRLPRAWAARLGARRARARRPFAVGLLNGLMPCGPLQSMQIVALATGNPLFGALSMLLFSLGTVPLMLGLGAAVSALGKRFARAVTQVGAVLVVVLGLAMLSQGGSKSGLLQPQRLLLLIAALSTLGVVASLSYPKAIHRALAVGITACAAVVLLFSPGAGGSALGGESDAEPNAAPELVDGVQVVNSTLSAGQYPNITVQAGIPVRWVIDAPEGSINGCNYQMILREYGVEHTFQQGENVIEFTPEQAGTFPYSCWMGMIRGNIFVTGTDGSASAAEGAPVPAGVRIPSDELAVAEVTADESGQLTQQVTIRLTESGFQPAVVVVQKDVPTRWVIRSQVASSGGSWLLAPAYATAIRMELGDNALSLYPSESFEVSTGDNASYAYVKVVQDVEQIDADAIPDEVDGFETLIYPSEIFTAASGASCCG